jgi:hypothetical protein
LIFGKSWFIYPIPLIVDFHITKVKKSISLIIFLGIAIINKISVFFFHQIMPNDLGMARGKAPRAL